MEGFPTQELTEGLEVHTHYNSRTQEGLEDHTRGLADNDVGSCRINEEVLPYHTRKLTNNKTGSMRYKTGARGLDQSKASYTQSPDAAW